MANNQNLKDAIAAVIKTNGNNEITGQLMQDALFSIINQFGSGAVFAGVANTDTIPGSPDYNVFYILLDPGVYNNIGGVELLSGEIGVASNISGSFDVVKKKVVAGTDVLDPNGEGVPKESAVSKYIRLDAGSLDANYMDVTNSAEVFDNMVMLTAYNGEMTENPNGLVYKIPVVSGHAVRFIGHVGAVTNNNFPVFWKFDELDNVEKVAKTVNGSYTDISDVEYIPDTDGYVYVNSRKGSGYDNRVYTSDNVVVAILTTESDVVGQAKNANDNVNKILNDDLGGQVEITGDPNISLLSGKVILSDSGSVTDNSGANLYKIPVLEGDVIRLLAGVGGLTNNSGFIALYQYGQDDTPIGTLVRTYTPGTELTDVNAKAVSNGFIYANTRIGSFTPRFFKGVNEYFVRNTNLDNTDVIQGINEEIDGLKSDILNIETYNKTKLTTYLYQNNFNTGWNFLNANYNTDNNIEFSATGGVAAITKRYISDIRVAKYRLSNATGVIQVGSLQNLTLSSLLYSSSAEIDLNNNTFTIFRGGASNGSASQTVLVSKSIGIDISNGEIIVEFKRYREVTTLVITNAYTMDSDSIYFDGSGVRFILGAGNHRPYYFISTTSPVIMREFSVTGAYDVQVAHVGDSISEANGRADTATVKNKNWVEKLIDYLGGQLINTSQSGMTVINGLEALENEINFMKPKTLSISLGTNGGFSLAQIQEFVTFANSRDIPIIINHIPMTPTRDPGNETSATVVNGNIDTFNLPKSLMDYATAIGGNIDNGADVSDYNTDQLHPNKQGNDKMYKRFLIDVTQINWV